MPISEHAALGRLRKIIGENKPHRSYLGMGFADCIVPPVIQRNLLENPGWYTQYTPYQAEIAQGRLESLLNFQTMVCDLTGLEIANASLLDEATACAEAMTMCNAVKGKGGRNVFVAATDCHPQNLAVLETRAEPLGIEVRTAPTADLEFDDTIFDKLGVSHMGRNIAFDLKCNLGIIYGTESNMMSDEILNFIAENVPTGTPMIPIEKAAHHVLLDQPLELAKAIEEIAIKWI